MNDKLIRVWKEMVKAYSEILSQNFPEGGAEEDQCNLKMVFKELS